MIFEATYLDGQSPIHRPIEIQLDGANLSFQFQGATRVVHLDYADIENVNDQLVYIFLNREQGERIEIKDVQGIFLVRQRSKKRYFSLSKNTGRKIVGGVILMVLVGFCLWALTPKIARQVAFMIPIEKEVLIQDKVLESFKDDVCQDPRITEILRKMTNRLTATQENPYPARVLLHRRKDVNAFALPGGLIFINEGLIAKAASAEVVAGVLSHELQHQIQRHILTQLIRASMMTLIWSAAVGDFSGVLVVDPSTLYSLASLKYNRDDETEADAQGMAMMKAAQISVRPALDFLDELSRGADKLGIPEFLSSHPIEDRGRKWRQVFGHIETSPEVLTSDEWAILKVGCPEPPQSE